MPATFNSRGPITEVGAEWLPRLKREAARAELRRARLCLHQSTTDTVQEMLIALCQDSLIHPHRHLDRSESFHVVEGELVVLIFDSRGGLKKRIPMAPIGVGKQFMYRLSSPDWHTVVPLSEFVVLHEVSAGPFSAEQRSYADWAPTAKPELRAFLQRFI
jgi:cupin fold WbuC family metalloprotein